ncbi:hypothetical protein ACFPMF_15530 [Larkinella bovis]|uniref:Uncharacterized protein n=1 Tax=Larkinella bovis TaxID=683041 RepID=A0ABW0IDY8_9BACT
MSKQDRTNRKVKAQPIVPEKSEFMLPSAKPQGRVKTGNFKMAATLAEQALKDNRPRAAKKAQALSNQTSLFSELKPLTQRQIAATKGVSTDWINERGDGIKLTPGEEKLLICLSKLLHQKSQNLDKLSDDYYTGNADPNAVVPENNTGKDLRFSKDPDLQGEPRKTATLVLTLYEIAKEYRPNSNIGGRDMRIVLDMLLELANNPEKRALIRYKREQRNTDNTRNISEIEGFEPLLNVYNHKNTKLSSEGVIINQTTEVIIRLNPVFRDQIESKYISLPEDLLSRIVMANGGSHKIPESTFRLIRYLAHAKANAASGVTKFGYNPEIYAENLFWKVAENYMRDPTRTFSYTQKVVERAIKIATDIGLLLGHKVTLGANNMPKYTFGINPDW